MYRRLVDDIARDRLPAGSLLREEEIGARLAVSRTPVRDALTRLKADGLVTQQPGQVAVVAAIDTDRTIETFQLVDAVETYLVQLAARSPVRGRFEELATAYRALFDGSGADIPDLEAVIALNDRFDAMLAEAAPNRMMLTALASTRGALLRLRMLVRADANLIREALRLRAAEATAIAAGDATAAAEVSHRRIAGALRHALTLRASVATAPEPQQALHVDA